MISKFFIEHPIFASVISIVIVIAGAVSVGVLPIAQYPELTPPMVVVSATYTGANALNVEQSVATPLEQDINGVENSIYMQSVNTNDGFMTLKVSFDVSTDPDMNNVLTQNRVSTATPKLPEEVKRLGVSTKKSLSFRERKMFDHARQLLVIEVAEVEGREMEEVEQEVAERIRILAPGGGFVFNTIHNIQQGTPPENIVAAYHTARTAGRYPIS